ncbi:MAG: tRNA(Ile)-lysidine synthase [Alphaproteobacteria bacterium MarineAlpha8_Bin1]|nr:MAG: tRNA(Ile)-lysidine synthase [Alphaproteobacteria bacterium MarineAlpha8_Bin1]
MKPSKLKLVENYFSRNLDCNLSFEENPHIGLCVSGGPDSMALVVLMNNWIKKNNGKITIFHFNHGLRKESEIESKFVKKFSNNLGYECKIIKWQDSKPKSGIMKTARNLRYKKIIEECKKKKILHLMTAHHHDDSLETFFMRSLRKKTYEGLFSIPFRRIHESLQIIRPLINFKKIKLKEICKFYNIDWISDSSNFNFFYERPRIRERLSNFSGKKLNFLAKELKKNKIDNENVEKKITDFFISNLRHNQNGSFEIGKTKLLKIKQNIQIEILRRILRTCSSKIYLPCLNSTKLILEKLKKYKISKFTLHSCLIVLKNDKILIYRESKATQKKMNKGLVVDIKNSNFWDNRFKIYSDKYELHCELITERNWVELKNNFYNGNNIPFDIIKTLPLIRFNKKKVIPFLISNEELEKASIDFYFSPKIPLTKKNFF